MKNKARYLAITIIAATASFSATASLFSSMSLAEVSEILDDMPAASVSAGSVMSASQDPQSVTTGQPRRIDVDALDLITKVYGVLDRASTRNECMSGAIDSLAIVPHEEQNCLWLDSDNGYNLAYRGMAPQVSAMARFDSDGSMTDYCYFFLFPYDSASRKTETQRQADFAGSLLQEMQDMGLDPGADPDTDELFDVYADCSGRFVNVRLLDDQTPDSSGRYILMLSVEPTPAPEADLADASKSNTDIQVYISI